MIVKYLNWFSERKPFLLWSIVLRWIISFMFFEKFIMAKVKWCFVWSIHYVSTLRYLSHNFKRLPRWQRFKFKHKYKHWLLFHMSWKWGRKYCLKSEVKKTILSFIRWRNENKQSHSKIWIRSTTFWNNITEKPKCSHEPVTFELLANQSIKQKEKSACGTSLY